MNERFVVLGTAPVRREWFRRVGRWANEAALPVEFVKCISTSEVISRLESGRPFSALLVDASSSGLDRDVLDMANMLGCAPIIVDHGLVDRDWGALGARAVLPERFEAGDLLATLDEHAVPIGRGDQMIAPSHQEASPNVNGRIVAVTGAGGVGTSTIAMALAQGLTQHDERQPLLLADMALRSSQAMFHDARDVVPGLTELVESHRLGIPNEAETAASIHTFPERRYDLLLGLRHERDWLSVPARALSATWTSLTNHYRTTVSDITGEFDGATETGSNDIEDRNRLARMAARQADLVVVIGTPGAWGVHHLVRTMLSLSELGVVGDRLLPIINHAPRQARARAGLTAAVGDLLASRASDAATIANPIFVPTKRTLEGALRDGDPLPTSISSPVSGAVAAMLAHTAPLVERDVSEAAPVPVAAGSLGTWSAND